MQCTQLPTAKINHRGTNLNKIVLFFLNLILPLFLFIAISSCHHPVEPVEELQPGRRDYEWSVDIIDDPFEPILRVWANTMTDIWATSPGTLWHFDGTSWTEQTGPFPFFPDRLFGFSKDDIWSCSTSDGWIWHYDGKEWKLHSKFPNHYCVDIWGGAPNEVYITGWRNKTSNSVQSFLLKYDGKNWVEIGTPIPDVGFYFVRKKGGDLIIKGETGDGLNGWTGKIYVYKNNQFQELYSGTINCEVTNIGERVFVWIKTKVFEYINGQLIECTWFSFSNYAGGFWGNNMKNIFCGTQDGIGHYNGTDLVTIYLADPKRFSIFFGGVLNDGVIIPAWDLATGYSFFFRGKLK